MGGCRWWRRAGHEPEFDGTASTAETIWLTQSSRATLIAHPTEAGSPSAIGLRAVNSLMTTTSPEQSKALVLEAFDTLFNKRDYAAAERFWSERYIQHGAHRRVSVPRRDQVTCRRRIEQGSGRV